MIQRKHVNIYIMTTNSKKTEGLVGIFLFIGLALLAGIILLFGNIGDWFQDRYEIKVSFIEAPGIIKGSTVRLRGAKIGEVAEKPILMGGSTIKVILAIDDQFQIDQGSVFQIGQASLLGDKEIIITPPNLSSHVYFSPGAEVVGSGPGGLEHLQNEAEGIAVDARAFLRDAKQTLTKIEASMDEVSLVASNLSMTVDRVDGRVLSDENVDNLSGTLANLDKASASFARIGEQLVPALDDFRMAINEVRETNQSVKGAIERVDPALKDVPRVLSSIEEVANKATAAIENVDRNKGALGALVSDQELKSDMKDFVRNLKKNGVLRYKDEDEKEEDPRDRFRGRRR